MSFVGSVSNTVTIRWTTSITLFFFIITSNSCSSKNFINAFQSSPVTTFSNSRRQINNYKNSIPLFSATSSSSSSGNSASSSKIGEGITTKEEASALLEELDKFYNKPFTSVLADDSAIPEEIKEKRKMLPEAVLLLNKIASEERAIDSTKGRCMLGICASSADEGVQALKSWVTALQLPKGLLHGMDKDGEPVQIDGGVYLKYNTGGSLTFSQIRNSGMGFDALWKPGDVLLEPYDGLYRGVYFQVELDDDVFRQYLLPLDTFM